MTSRFVFQWMRLILPNCVHNTAAVVLIIEVCFVSLTHSKLYYQNDAKVVWASRLFTKSKAVGA
jgi:hypothetical protein